MKFVEALHHLLPDLEDGADQLLKNLIAFDPFAHSPIEPSQVHLADLQAEWVGAIVSRDYSIR